MKMLVTAIAIALSTATGPTLGDGPQDNRAESVRRIPPPGVEVGADDRRELETLIGILRAAIDGLRPTSQDLKADLEIYHKAAQTALVHGEFFAPADINKAKSQLREGIERAESLRVGLAPWTSQAGPVVRGYVSKLDGSVQPYGVVVPESYGKVPARRYRLDLWLHGRGETLSEVNFLEDRRKNPGQFTPADTIVLHPYGRYCNANKFAGEVDVWEALDAVRRQYPIDDDRISVRGFSMGGASAWHLAVHHADRWFAANPGAGFSETPQFLKVFQREALEPAWFEQKLWRLYDCPDVAANLKQCPTVAYSGELDGQKQAADLMEEALKGQEIKLVHIIGPQTKHAFHPKSKVEIEEILAGLARRGRRREPESIDLVTFTLKYPKMHWVTVEALDEHWEEARVRARVETREGRTRLAIRTKNVRALSLDFSPGSERLADSGRPTIEIDGTTLEGPMIGSDRSWSCDFSRGTAVGSWTTDPLPEGAIRKRHDLQGPIDDAFMGPFLFVKPTGKASHPRVAEWADRERVRAEEQWRRQFRGDAPVVDDARLTDEQIASKNLVLWGDPESNSVMKQVIDRLPISWDRQSLKVGESSYRADGHVPILIAPNPLNPSRYVVLNSGFTFREYDALNNARQVPKLPDWAVIDLSVPPDSRYPGKIADAGFFDESWRWKPREAVAKRP